MYELLYVFANKAGNYHLLYELEKRTPSPRIMAAYIPNTY